MNGLQPRVDQSPQLAALAAKAYLSDAPPLMTASEVLALVEGRPPELVGFSSFDGTKLAALMVDGRPTAFLTRAEASRVLEQFALAKLQRQNDLGYTTHDVAEPAAVEFARRFAAPGGNFGLVKAGAAFRLTRPDADMVITVEAGGDRTVPIVSTYDTTLSGLFDFVDTESLALFRDVALEMRTSARRQDKENLDSLVNRLENLMRVAAAQSEPLGPQPRTPGLSSMVIRHAGPRESGPLLEVVVHGKTATLQLEEGTVYLKSGRRTSPRQAIESSEDLAAIATRLRQFLAAVGPEAEVTTAAARGFLSGIEGRSAPATEQGAPATKGPEGKYRVMTDSSPVDEYAAPWGWDPLGQQKEVRIDVNEGDVTGIKF